jgi:hypothetical protein
MQGLRKQASWLSRDPIIKDGEVQSIEPDELLPTDLILLQHAYEFYLDPIFGAALIGQKPETVRRRFRQLKREPYPYLDIAPAIKAKPKRFWNEFKHVVLGSCGEKTLKEKGIILPPRYPHSSSFDHDVLAHQDILSALIARERHWAVIDLILPSTLMETLPPETPRNKAWFDFPISFEIDGKAIVRPDYFPLGVIRNFDPDVPLFFVMELETGTNHIPKSNYKTSNVGQKVLAWLDVLQRDTYNTRLGLNSLYIVFSLVDAKRVEDMPDLITTLVPKEFQQYFLWKHHPTFAEEKPFFTTYREEKAWHRQKEKEKYARLGYFLEDDFQRVSGMFNFITSEE